MVWSLLIVVCVTATPGLLRAQDTTAIQLQALPHDMPRHFGVIGIRLAGQDENLQVTHVRVGSPADAAGVQVGDRLRGADAYRLTTLQETLDYMQSLPPDSSVVLHLRRGDRPLTLTSGVTDRRRLYGLMLEQGHASPLLGPRHEHWLAGHDDSRQRMDDLILQMEATEPLQQLQRAFAADAQAYGYDCRLPDITFGLQHPTAAALPIATLAEELHDTGDSERVRSLAARLISHPRSRPDTGETTEQSTDQVATVPASAGPDTVFASLEDSPLQRALFGTLWQAGQLVTAALPQHTHPPGLLQDVTALLDRFDQTFYLDEGDRDETLRHTATLRWAKQVDITLMAEALTHLADLAEPRALDSIRRAARSLPSQLDPELPPGFSGDLHFAARTAWGWVVVGGEGPTVYGQDAAVVIDLGGDDLYLGGGRVAATPTQPVSLIIDLAGDDRYIDRRPVGIGAAIAGVAAIIDVRGDDLYEGAALTQASTFAGGAMLIDLKGDDTYLGELMSQATAMFGVAMLVDHSGKDLYSAAQFAQGFAGPRAVAALIDERGADRYLADRSRPSGYRTAGVYKGWAQGAGCGLRGFAAGGIGLLLDERGDDEYQGGNFSQGIGYFFGLGGLVDQAGHDRYTATRYSQGSSAHQAIGVLLDREGNDHYEGRIAANQGAAWDASIGLLIDGSGNDVYQGAGLSQGAAAMNGFAALLDHGGDDDYQSASGQADGGSTQYWGGRDAPNLGILIDGSGSDTYSREGRRDGQLWRRPNIGLFLDQP